MRKFFSVSICIFCFNFFSFSQAYFTSNNTGITGNWNDPTVWTLVSGTSSTNYPVAGDSVIIINGDSILISANAQCQSLSIQTSKLTLNTTSTLTVSNNVLIQASNITINSGAFTITGNLTINQGSTLTQTGGAISVIGLIFITAPTSSQGTTLAFLNGGLFNCVGGLTITGTTLNKTAKLFIGQANVTVAGALTTLSANGQIAFSNTDNGTLNIAGIVTISNTASFTPGTGRVTFVGIPGSNQAVTPLTYYNLAITGGGNGYKTISGSVTVMDTLSLLSDTLTTTGSGSLKLNSGATVIKTAGTLLSAPTYLGTVDILYNNLLKDTTGAELPVSNAVLRNLTINDVSGLKLAANAYVNNMLTLQNGELFTDNFVLTINNPSGGTATDSAISVGNGYVKGTISRYIGTSTGVRTFPLGISLMQGYREYKIEYTTAPSVAGYLSVQHFNTAASAQSGLPLTDGAVSIVNTAAYYWQADALSGLSGGTYNLTLTAQGSTGITDITTLRTVKRPSAGGNWILDGTAGTNSGTNNAPVVVRTGMSNFSQFTIGLNSVNTLPLHLLDFTATLNGQNVLLKWTTTDEKNSAYFGIEKSADGISFIEKGKVVAFNNSSVANNYNYQDESITGGKFFYRLKITDIDGRFSYSPVVSVTVTQTNKLVVYPLLCSNSITVSGNANQTIYLYGANGTFIKKLNNGLNDISGLANGVYVVKTISQTIKIVKQ